MESTKPTPFQQTLNREPSQTFADTAGTYADKTNTYVAGQDAYIPPPMSDKAKTYDDGKLPLAQIPWAAIDELAKVQQYGHSKYGDFNNYRKGMEVTRNLSCALRHIRDYLSGQDRDAESGQSPLAHALCRIAFVLQNIHDGVAIDDRYKPRYQEVIDGENLIKEWGRQKP